MSSPVDGTLISRCGSRSSPRPGSPFHRPRYGGIEWVVSILADGLVDHGHEVTLFAAGDSQTRARLVTSYDEPP